MDKDCIFCKIINNEIPSDRVYEDESTLAFMDLRPVSRGHILVVPKQHSENLLNTDDHSLQNLMPKVKKIANAVMQAVQADGINVTTNNGAASGQVIFHLHFHLIPRFNKDDLKPWPHHEAEQKTRSEIAEAVKKNL